ncbi:MAG: DUF6531 domain-containing protein [bacterium]
MKYKFSCYLAVCCTFFCWFPSSAFSQTVECSHWQWKQIEHYWYDHDGGTPILQTINTTEGACENLPSYSINLTPECFIFSPSQVEEQVKTFGDVDHDGFIYRRYYDGEWHIHGTWWGHADQDLINNIGATRTVPDHCPCDASILNSETIANCGVTDNIASIDYETCTYECYTSIPDDSGLGNDDDPCSPEFQGNPINILNGNKYEAVTDLILPTPNQKKIQFERFYNSQSDNSENLGHGWSNSYSINMSQLDLSNVTHFRIGDSSGRGYYFKQGVGNRWDGAFKEKSYILAEVDNTYTWYKTDGSTYGFNSQGQLFWMEDSLGNLQNITYYPSGLLKTVTDVSSGRVLTFYDSNNDLLIDYITGPITPTVPDGIWVTYGYDANSNLTSVTYADGSGFIYEYNDANDIHNLTAKKDALGRVISSWTYDAQDRAISSTSRDPEKTVTIDYSNLETNSTIDVTDAYGVTRTNTISYYDVHFPKITNVTGPGDCTSCMGEMPIRYAYDSQLNVTEKEYANGTISKYENYDDHGNPQTVILAFGTPEQRTISSTYHPATGRKMTEVEQSILGTGNKETIWDFDDDYDDIANETEILTNLVHRKIEQGYSKDANGVVVPYQQISTYTYNTKGQVLSVDGPLAGTQDTTTYAYDPGTGNLTSITQPLIGTTTFSSYDDAGNILTVVDVNGQTITYTYDGKNRLLSTSSNGVENSRSFNLAGDLESVTSPGNRALVYGYYTSGRLNKITDMLGNYLAYGYDDQGSVIEDYAFDSNDIAQKWLQYDYNNPDKPGKLWRVLYPGGGVTQYLYDEMNNISSGTDPLNRVTSYQYDALNRLNQIIEPGTPSPTTVYKYDSQGNLETVTDATEKITTYEYDDMGRVLKIISPDSGTTTYVYDVANNQMHISDANNITGTYTFDALGRLIDIDFPDTVDDVTFVYDESTSAYGKGKLTSLQSPSGTTLYQYNYNNTGQLKKEERKVAPLKSIEYNHSLTSGDIGTITYPSGTIVTYGRNSNGQISAIQADGQNVISSISYMPFGPIEDYVLGANVLTVDRTFNQRYQPDRIQSGSVMDYQYKYYADGNV